MFHKEIRYSYNDVMIRPAVCSSINSRSECNPYNEDGYLPIFTAPMTSVLDMTNYDIYDKYKIRTILPRSVDYSKRLLAMKQGCWVALSLSEFKNLFLGEKRQNYYNKVRVLIDVANGHMCQLFMLAGAAKELYGNDMELMIGNIANAETYWNCCKANVDWVRVGIGGGSGCITSSNTGIHDGQVSLLDDIFTIKEEFKKSHGGRYCKVVADGGIRNSADIMKALAVGADAVMIGGELAKLWESSGYTFTLDGKDEYWFNPMDTIGDAREDGVYVDGLPVYKRFYGMASRQGQLDISGLKTKTSEGIEKKFRCTTTIAKWTENTAAYMRSAMSYCDIRDIEHFNPYNVETYIISPNTKCAINK